jgi:hypothetical protein
MKKLLKFFVIPVVATMLSLTATGVAKAGKGDMKYGYHLGDAFLGCVDESDLPTAPPIDVIAGTPTCRPEAVAGDTAGAFPLKGGSIAIQGSGEIKVSKKGKPKHVNGGGLFAQFDLSGNPTSSGTWKAKKLLSFDPYGEGDRPPLPGGYEAGRVLIRIELKPEGGKKVDAVLEIGCRLPGNAGIVGTIEGARVFVDGGLNYNLAADPKSTLFVNLQNFVPVP